jgi:predicted N-acetyltransferase YhbS
MTQIRQAEPDEYRSILRCLAEAYHVSADFFPRNYPTWWKKEYTDFRHVWILEKEGNILSLLRIFPLKLRMGEVTVDVAGVGGVCTAPAARGQGYMQRVMFHALEAMKKESFPLSVLWGDRHRYRLFGYEQAGSCCALRLTSRGLKKTGADPLAPRVFHGEEDLLASITQAYRAHPFHRLRAEHEDAVLYNRAGLVTWCGEGEGNFGYLSLFTERGETQVAEFGGHSRTVLRLAAHALAEKEIAALKFVFPARDLVLREFREAASSWGVESGGMVKVVHLSPALKIFRPFLTADPAAAEPSLLSMPEPEAVDCLFGVGRAGAAPFYIWPLDRV